MKMKNQYPIDTVVCSLTTKCNLGCYYCQTGPYMNSLEQTRIDIKVFTTLIRDLLEYFSLSSRKQITFCFAGGEPLLIGIEFFKEIVRTQKYYNMGKELEIYNIIQTNGTLLDSEWIDFFADNNFCISISLDGPDEIQNSHRPFKNGKGSFDTILENIKRLKQRKIDFGIISVITENSASKANILLPFFFKLSPRLIAILPCMDRGDKVTPDSWGKFLIDAFDIWINPIINKKSIPIRTFQNLVSNYFNLKPNTECDYFGVCPRHINIAPNGEVSICDQFVGKSSGYLGNIIEESLVSIIENKFSSKIELSKSLPIACYDCKFLNYCKGGCLYRREINNGFEPFCESRERFFRHFEAKISSLSGITK